MEKKINEHSRVLTNAPTINLPWTVYEKNSPATPMMEHKQEGTYTKTSNIKNNIKSNMPPTYWF